MKTLEEKLALLVESVDLLTKVESYGNCDEHKVKTQLIIEHNKNGINLITTRVNIIFPYSVENTEDINEIPGNWTSFGDTVNDALNGSLYCIELEMRSRVAGLTQCANAIEHIRKKEWHEDDEGEGDVSKKSEGSSQVES